MATVRLLGPDLKDENLIVEGLEVTQTVLDLKEKALKNWPASARAAIDPEARPANIPPATERSSSASSQICRCR